MRVELIYTPGCASYKTALDRLESVIAEERLPIPVELVESNTFSPTIRIDGNDIDEAPNNALGPFCRLYDTNRGIASAPCLDRLREIIFGKWKELTEIRILHT